MPRTTTAPTDTEAEEVLGDEETTEKAPPRQSVRKQRRLATRETVLSDEVKQLVANPEQHPHSEGCPGEDGEARIEAYDLTRPPKQGGNPVRVTRCIECGETVTTDLAA